MERKVREEGAGRWDRVIARIRVCVCVCREERIYVFV